MVEILFKYYFLKMVKYMVSFGDSKHESVKPVQNALDATYLTLALSAKCTRQSFLSPRLFVLYFEL